MQIESPDLKYGKETATASSSDWLTAKLRYAPLGGGDVREVEKVVTEQDWSADPGDDWRLSAAVTEFGMLLRDSSFKGTSSFDGIKTLVGSAGDAQRTEFLELVDLAQKN
jgi:Ca-activated chloride channel family protein